MNADGGCSSRQSEVRVQAYAVARQPGEFRIVEGPDAVVPRIPVDPPTYPVHGYGRRGLDSVIVFLVTRSMGCSAAQTGTRGEQIDASKVVGARMRNT